MMTMRKIPFVAVGALALALVVSCGGSSTSTPFGTPSSSGSSSSGSSGTGTGTSATKYEMGSGSGSTFDVGAIDISNASLAAGGTATLEVSVVNADNADALYTGGQLTVTFSSSCLAAGTATLAASGPTTTAGTTADTFTTNTGEVEVTYTAAGCSGSDVVTSTSVVNSVNLQASGTLTVAAASIGSLQFVSATPTTIGLKGTGVGDTSTVVFKVLDSTGAPRPGATVSFALNTSVGGLSLSPASAESGSDGDVQTVVSSGTVHTAVRVTASIASPALSTQSSQLTVTTGLPTSGGFSIAIGSPTNYPKPLVSPAPACPNVEAYAYDGLIVPVSVWLSDRYNNPAPDGTAVAFTTDAGQIVGACPSTQANPSGGTIGGTCTVNWTSANPRPSGGAGSTQDNPVIPSNGDGVILATAIGEESFVDSTGSGFYVQGDSFSNLGEPYLDENQDGIYEYPYEPFLDYYKTGKYEGPSGSFIGIICNGTSATSTCTENTLAIGAEHVIIMSEGDWNPAFATTGFGGSVGAGLTITSGGAGSVSVTLVDSNGNPISAGSSITAAMSSSVGSVTMPGAATVYMGCSAYPNPGFSVPYSTAYVTAATVTAATSGTLTITVTSEGTQTVTTVVIPVTVNP